MAPTFPHYEPGDMVWVGILTASVVREESRDGVRGYVCSLGNRQVWRPVTVLDPVKPINTEVFLTNGRRLIVEGISLDNVPDNAGIRRIEKAFRESEFTSDSIGAVEAAIHHNATLICKDETGRSRDVHVQQNTVSSVEAYGTEGALP